MKLSDLISHTVGSFDISKGKVDSVAKYLRGAALLSSSGRGPGGAEMTGRDASTFLIGLCCIEMSIRASGEIPKWTERCPGLIEHIESCIKNPPADTSVEFDVDGYCARFVRKDGKVKTFGKRPEAASYLTRTVTAKAFRAWLEGLRD